MIFNKHTSNFEMQETNGLIPPAKVGELQFDSIEDSIDAFSKFHGLMPQH